MKMVFTIAAFAAGLAIGVFYNAKTHDPIALLEAQGQKEWPHYANYKGSYSQATGVPINSAVSHMLGGNVTLGLKEKPDVEFRNGEDFKKAVRNFAVAVLKYPKPPIYGVESDDGDLSLCIGDYGNCAGALTIARLPK
jgi:hypothetical protein